jgi:hypothetical protein
LNPPLPFSVGLNWNELIDTIKNAADAMTPMVIVLRPGLRCEFLFASQISGDAPK